MHRSQCARRGLAMLIVAVSCVACPRKADTDTAAPDADLDGFSAGEDCDDSDPATHPGAQERCDEKDNDCDSAIDEDAASWYADADGDGYGDPADELPACERPERYVASATDCDDTDPAVNPAATEVCNGIDDDCDGAVDDEDRDVQATTWYEDGDSDGYGGDGGTILGCDQPKGYAERGGDCDDADPEVHPGAEDIPGDGVDNDCNGWKNDCDPDARASGPAADFFFEGLDEGGHNGSWIFGLFVELGDVNGDGCVDVLIGEYAGIGGYEDEPKLLVQYGPVTGEEDYWDLDVHLQVGYHLSSFSSLSAGGDVDGDGIDDILTGDINESTSSGVHSGAVRLEYGSAGPLSEDYDAWDAQWHGSQTDAWLGQVGEIVGDMDGDGYDEILVGVDADHTHGESISLVYGRPTRFTGSMPTTAADVRITINGESGLGAVPDRAEAGDLDGDGLVDLLFADNAEDSKGEMRSVVYLRYGSTTREAGVVDAIDSDVLLLCAEGEHNSSYGCPASVVGDMDGDGYGEVLLGSPLADSWKGGAFLVGGDFTESTKSSAWVEVEEEAEFAVHGVAVGDLVGTFVSAAGDLDQDGEQDLGIGCEGCSSSTTGRTDMVLFFHGPHSGSVLASEADDALDYSDANLPWLRRLQLGDVTGDGTEDLVLSAPDPGRVFFFVGPGI